MQSLVESNRYRAKLIAAACADRLRSKGIVTAWNPYYRNDDLDGQLRTDTLIQYQLPNDNPERYTRLFFHNPKLTDIQTVNWGEEVALEKDVVERFFGVYI